MADQRILATENMIGANHPTLTDTLNRLSMVEHNIDGTHKSSLTFTTPNIGAATATSINGLIPTSQSVGFTIAGGTTSKTLTVPLDATVSGINTGDQTNISGNAATATTATKLATPRAINGVNFDGSAAITVPSDVAPGTLGNVLTSNGAGAWVSGAPGGVADGDKGDIVVSGSGATWSLDINGATAKTAPVDADYLPLMDSEASNVMKKLSWAYVKSVLKTYFDTIYGAATIPVPVRQTVLTGSVDANGYSNFITPTAGTTLSVDIAATSVPLVIAFAYGFDANGAVDKIGRITADTAIGSLTANRAAATPCFLYADRNTSTGAITYGHVILAPTYQYGGTPSTTANQHTYRIDEGKMYVGNGSTATVVQRVFLGEASTDASDVLAVVNYAYQGKYDSGWFTTTAATTYNMSHKIGHKVFNLTVLAADDTSGTNTRNALDYHDNGAGVAVGYYGYGAQTANSMSYRTGPNGSGRDTSTGAAQNSALRFIITGRF